MLQLLHKSTTDFSKEPPRTAGPLELSIVMPCLNEAETLGTCIGKASRFLRSTNIAGEIVVADNGSTDDSRAIARAMGARVIDVPVKGYGAALQAGLAGAKGRFVVMGDSDDSYDFSDLMLFVEKLRAGFELVMGNRFAGTIAAGAMPLLHKYLGNPLLSFVGRLFFKVPIGDFHCGLRGFDRAAIAGLGLNTTGMEFASEMVVKAGLHRLKITEVPTNLAKDGRSRPPHLRTWRDGWRHLVFLLLHCPRWLFLVPALFLAGAGVILMSALLPGPLRIGHSALDVHSMVVASAMIDTGVQTLMFWYLAQQYAVSNGVLPGTLRFNKALSVVTLERTLILGGLIGLVGCAGLVRAVWHWGSLGFGPLDYEISLRQVVPSTTLVVLGLQVVFFAFLTSILKLGPIPKTHTGTALARTDGSTLAPSTGA